MSVQDNVLRRQALSVIASELRSYDLLSHRSKLRYERAVQRAIDVDALAPMSRCAHNVFLHEPCTKCERSLEECEVYLRAAMSRLKSLLSILEKGEQRAKVL